MNHQVILDLVHHQSHFQRHQRRIPKKQKHRNIQTSKNQNHKMRKSPHHNYRTVRIQAKNLVKKIQIKVQLSNNKM